MVTSTFGLLLKRNNSANVRDRHEQVSQPRNASYHARRKMCVKQFLGFICGHCSIPTLRKCPISLQIDSYPACAIPAEHPIWVNDYCPACGRVVWNNYVLAQERDHEAKHARGECHCNTDFNLQREYPLRSIPDAQTSQRNELERTSEPYLRRNPNEHGQGKEEMHRSAQDQSGSFPHHAYFQTQPGSYQKTEYFEGYLGNAGTQQNISKVARQEGAPSRSAGMQAEQLGYGIHEAATLTRNAQGRLNHNVGSYQEHGNPHANSYGQAHSSQESCSVEDYLPHKYGLHNVAGGLRYYPVNAKPHDIGRQLFRAPMNGLNHRHHLPFPDQGRGHRRGTSTLGHQNTKTGRGRPRGNRSAKSSTGSEGDKSSPIYTAGNQVKGTEAQKATK
ncbi:hypothetical protein BP6252_02644 [Coleophoma cylindrospora]|uniref:Uncharacterized protein n=1 Tax=Coleophoma cylindrospora TaxID=1849047 RepID=A0A3D8SFX8_9HELO|nr:hypothetical protein BP6252_02644 [Coleophoma cylindrospora]